MTHQPTITKVPRQAIDLFCNCAELSPPHPSPFRNLIFHTAFRCGIQMSTFLAFDKGNHNLPFMYPQARRIIIQKKREPVSFISRKALDCLYHHETKTTHALTIYKGFYISKKGERYFSFRGTANCPDSPAGMKLNASYNMCVPEGTGQRYGIFS